MKYAGSLLAALVVVATTVGDGVDRPGSPLDNSAPASRIGARPPEPPNAPVRIGDSAPDFNWVGADGGTRRLRDVLEHAHALVVFAPSDQVLRDLERERETLGLMGVVPVAVMEARPRSVAVRAKRTDSHFLMVPDPVRVVGAQFDMIDSNTNRLEPGWFAIDKRGTVRGAGTALEPPQGWARIAASALAIPAPDATVPTRTR